MLDYFFSVQVRLVIEAQYPNLYTVYSGGDDLCVIGAWQEIIDFVVEIQKEFTRFVGGVNDLTISGGIALVDNKLPVTRMNDETEEQLINAKDTPGKNRIAFLGLCITWDEFERLIATGKIFSKWLKQKEISTSLIYGFVYQSRNAEEFERGDLRRENALWKSHFLYNLKRAETRNKLSEEKVSMMKSFAVDAGKMKLARIPATYALYVNRESKNTKGGE